MLHTFYLVDFTFTGTVNIRVASLGATALNIAPIAMTKREGGYSASVDVPEGAIAVSYQSTDTPRTIDTNEIVLVSAPTVTEVDLTPVLDAIAEIPTNPLLETNYVAPNNTAIATAVEGALSTQLDTIQTLATIATEPILNKTVIDSVAKTYTVFRADGTTPRVVKDLFNSTDDPSSEAVYSEVPRP